MLGAALIAVSLGVYARTHPPARRETVQLLSSGMLPCKAWTTTLILALAIFQLLSALHMYGRLRPGRAVPDWLGLAHRLSGTVAFLASLPVVFHCLWSIGFTPVADLRAGVHAVLGCVFYGATVIEVAAVHGSGCPAGCCRRSTARSRRVSNLLRCGQRVRVVTVAVARPTVPPGTLTTTLSAGRRDRSRWAI